MKQNDQDLKKILQKEEEIQMKRFLMHKKLNKYQENKNFQNIQKKIQVIKQDQDYLDKVGLKHKIYLSNPQKDEKEMRQAFLINKMQQDSKKDSFREMQRNSLRIQQQILVSQEQLEKIYKNKKFDDKNKVYNIKLEDQNFQNKEYNKNFNTDVENDQQNQKFLQYLDNDKKNIDISNSMQVMNFQGQRSTKRIFNDIQLVQTPLMEETIKNNRIFQKKTNIYKEFLGLSKNVDEDQNQLKDKFQKFYQNNKIFKTGSQDENQNKKEENICQNKINSDKNIVDKVLERQFSKTSNFTINSLQQRLKQQEKEKERIQKAQYQKEKIEKAEQKQRELLELQKQQILTIGHIGVQFSEDPSDQEEENEILEQEMQKKRKSYAQWMLESKGFNNNHNNSNNNKGSKFGRKLKSQQSQLSSKKSLTDRQKLKKGIQMGTSGQLDYKQNQFSQVKGLEKASSLVVQKGYYDSASKKKYDMSKIGGSHLELLKNQSEKLRNNKDLNDIQLIYYNNQNNEEKHTNMEQLQNQQKNIYQLQQDDFQIRKKSQSTHLNSSFNTRQSIFKQQYDQDKKNVQKSQQQIQNQFKRKQQSNKQIKNKVQENNPFYIQLENSMQYLINQRKRFSEIKSQQEQEYDLNGSQNLKIEQNKVPYKQQSRKEMLQDRIADNERLQLLEKDCSIEQSLDIVENDRKISEGILKQLKGMTSDTNLDKTLENLVEKQSFHKNLLGQEIDEQFVQQQKKKLKSFMVKLGTCTQNNKQLRFLINQQENYQENAKSINSQLEKYYKEIDINGKKLELKQYKKKKEELEKSIEIQFGQNSHQQSGSQCSEDSINRKYKNIEDNFKFQITSKQHDKVKNQRHGINRIKKQSLESSFNSNIQLQKLQSKDGFLSDRGNETENLQTSFDFIKESENFQTHIVKKFGQSEEKPNKNFRKEQDMIYSYYFGGRNLSMKSKNSAKSQLKGNSQINNAHKNNKKLCDNYYSKSFSKNKLQKQNQNYNNWTNISDSLECSRTNYSQISKFDKNFKNFKESEQLKNNINQFYQCVKKEDLSQKKKSESLQSKLDQNFENINERFVKMCKNLSQEEFQKKQTKY